MDIFETGFIIIVPVGLVLVMFGMDLSLSLDDFRRVFEFPKAALLNMKEMALTPSIYAALMLITGGLFAWFMARRHSPVNLDGSK